MMFASGGIPRNFDIMFVLPSFSGGGAERVAILLANALAGRGAQVQLVVFSGEGPLRNTVSERVGVCDLGTIRLRGSIFRLCAHIRALKPTVVFSTLGYVNLALLAMRPMWPRQTRLWIREANLPSLSLPYNKFPSLMHRGYRLLYRRAERLICSSERMRAEFISYFGMNDSNLYCMSNPVDVAFIRVAASVPHRVPGEGLRFVASGRLTFQKGFDRLIEMLPGLRASNAVVSILGDGPELERLRAQAQRQDVEKQLRFHGFVDNPWAWYAGADAFLMPSRWEGMPNAALEALACGTPVIATPESGGIGEVAAKASENAVTLAEYGPDFIAEMNRFAVGRELQLRPSLLPADFHLSNVVSLFKGWLDEARR